MPFFYEQERGPQGIQGAEGPQGPQGEPGINGSPDTPAEVRQKVADADDCNVFTDTDKTALDTLANLKDLPKIDPFIYGQPFNRSGSVGISSYKKNKSNSLGFYLDDHEGPEDNPAIKDGMAKDQKGDLGTDRRLVPGICLDLDGTQLVRADNHLVANYDTNQSFTISCWIKTTATTGGNANGIFYKRSTSSHIAPGYSVIANGSGTTFRISDGTDTRSVHVAAINDGQWHLVICVYDAVAKTISIFIDGDTAGTVAGTSNITGSIASDVSVFAAFGALAIGSGSSYQHFVGSLWDGRVIPAALNSDQRTELYDEKEKALQDVEHDIQLRFETDNGATVINSAEGDDFVFVNPGNYGEDPNVPGCSLNTIGYSVRYGKTIPAATHGETDAENQSLDFQGLAHADVPLVESNCLHLDGSTQRCEFENPVSLDGPFRLELGFDLMGIRSGSFRTLFSASSVPIHIGISNTAQFFIRWENSGSGDKRFDVLPIVDAGPHKVEIVRDEANDVSIIYDGVVMPISHNIDRVIVLERFGMNGLSGFGGNDPAGGKFWNLVARDRDVPVFDVPMSEGGGSSCRSRQKGNRLSLVNDGSNSWSESQNVFHSNLLNGFSVANNLEPGSSVDNGWSSTAASGTEPPVVGFEVYKGKPCKTVLWDTNISAVGYAGSRARGGTVQASLVSGKNYVWRATLRANRNLNPGEQIYLYYVGGSALKSRTINEQIDLSDWVTVESTSHSQTVNTNVLFTIFKSSTGSFSSDFKIYIAELQIVESDSFGGISYYPTVGEPFNNEKIPSVNNQRDVLGNKTSNPATGKLNGCETKLDLRNLKKSPGYSHLPDFITSDDVSGAIVSFGVDAPNNKGEINLEVQP